MRERRLRSEIVPASTLSSTLREHLFRLYDSCYNGVAPERFARDFAEKHWIILLRDAGTSLVAGFSTQMLMEIQLQEKKVNALFSGDTVIHPDYWGSQELVHAWCRLAGKLKAESGDRPLYWFLISKGYRTYLYLPCFFHAFYPRYDEPTPPFEAKLISTLGRAKYPNEFNPCTGLIEHRGPHDRLKIELDASARRRSNPHVAYFLARNPLYGQGNELVCVAEIAPRNMRSIAGRELARGLRAMDSFSAYDV